ncbi:hypothetical protein GS597_09080 [Synechococcales cyanobacterium C]|uniref:Uncharacterized protein n=1 Tax=Petrachloros mirabilis ULC683 TaxID=2781853 RepID=A0A8K2A815_9CYAN|nr:hypothetical protein [Petrachloros mirabilis]NCJ06655.1 hypothetical protein [Petrachloros mirabilis ULC683]
MREMPAFRPFQGQIFELIDDRRPAPPSRADYRHLRSSGLYSKFRSVPTPYGFWALYGLPREEPDV